MKRPEPDSPAAQARAQAAADWLVKRDRGLAAAEQDEFLQWLAADPRHGEWFALHRRVVGDFTCLAQWRPEHSDEPNPNLLAPLRRSPRPRTLVSLAVAAGVAVLALWWRPVDLLSSRGATTPAASGGYAQRSLEDGSVVELNRGAVIDVRYTGAERRVTLLRGEALFTVEKNARRPFIVHARGVDVRAVGTAFQVRLATGSVEVFVTEGRVQVAPPRRAPSAAAGNGPLVEAGHRAVVSLEETTTPPKIVPVSAEEAAHLLAWQPRLLDFSSAPLERVVAEFNRRNSVELVLADSSLAALPIVASIRSDNVEGLVRFLETNAGIRAERRGSDTILLRRK
jgi:transmembrane sensor